MPGEIRSKFQTLVMYPCISISSIVKLDDHYLVISSLRYSKYRLDVNIVFVIQISRTISEPEFRLVFL